MRKWLVVLVACLWAAAVSAEEPGLLVMTVGVGPYLALGLAHGFIPLGPGTLGLDVGAEALITSVAVESGDDAGSAVGSAIEAAVLSLLGAVKIQVSVLNEMRQ